MLFRSTSRTRSTTAGSISSTINGATGRTDGAMKVVGVVAEAAKASELFSKLADLFYDRFKKEDEIDERRKSDFIENGIPNAPPLTGDEKKMIEESMELVEDVASRGKRIAGTVNESVEKFLYRDGEGGAAVGMTVAKVDVAAVKLFTEVSNSEDKDELLGAKRRAGNMAVKRLSGGDGNVAVKYGLWNSSLHSSLQTIASNPISRSLPHSLRSFQLWLLDTYARKSESKQTIREVYNDLDGTRSMQYTTSASLPGGFQDRLFEAWITFEKVEANGLRTYIIAFCPIEKYKGTHHKVEGAEKMQDATSRGLYMVKELTDNTCEMTILLQVDLKITVLPARVLDIVAKQELSLTYKLQEKFRRNGKEVDRERVTALAGVMSGRKGLPLIEDQVGFFERCMTLSGKEDGEGWKVLESHCPDVKMWMQYFPPRKGERNIATGKAVGVVEGSAEEVAAWAFTYCSNER
mgnify:CR=1 FL=1